jgi:hypothetical protein
MEMVYWVDSDTWKRPSSNDDDAHPILMPIAESLEDFYNALTVVPKSI